MWVWVTDIGDRAVFINRTHGFTVGIPANGAAAMRRNCVYVALLKSVRDPVKLRAVMHDVGVVHLRSPKPPVALHGELSSCKVPLGEVHWIVKNEPKM
ncbi:hypothetical protein ABZP36_009889 [Zizania latifolia]